MVKTSIPYTVPPWRQRGRHTKLFQTANFYTQLNRNLRLTVNSVMAQEGKKNVRNDRQQISTKSTLGEAFVPFHACLSWDLQSLGSNEVQSCRGQCEWNTFIPPSTSNRNLKAVIALTAFIKVIYNEPKHKLCLSNWNNMSSQSAFSSPSQLY